MSAVMTDVSSRLPPRDARVFAVVHEDNHRSLAVWPSSSGGSLITASSSPAKISRPSLMLATGITFSVHPPAL
jgi:hypothetical protein